ncbi:monovalent cation/H+ antiporter complex subunit F [Actinoplanes sp. KI2]|uniref:monovalent cation/H+ antiporter complex subunit F n=1 Tax=Actinoplanes sp. KI2 TaxID=2983315 RepID=UPI0021D603CC|nr:monovalent cation/H+ antiporter complex subunit F [Actinoplanes sp. KI2]MCU7726265.1 monovalent cation/H+ antiporter complex subunit F [Actinoplanes sp. KI2]
MTLLLGAGLVLIIGALAPAVYLGLRGGPLDRLVGLQLSGALLVPAMLLLSYGYGQTSYLIVPLVLAVLSFAGVLVFLRLLSDRP